MKQIRVNKNFTLQLHQMDLRTYEAGKTYEVEDAVADHWWVRAHSEVLGEQPKAGPTGVSLEEVLKAPVPNAKPQTPLVMAPKKKAKEGPFEEVAVKE